jgi:hypothetical protein
MDARINRRQFFSNAAGMTAMAGVAASDLAHAQAGTPAPAPPQPAGGGGGQSAVQNAWFSGAPAGRSARTLEAARAPNAAEAEAVAQVARNCRRVLSVCMAFLGEPDVVGTSLMDITSHVKRKPRDVRMSAS